jgi:hypothetical protein
MGRFDREDSQAGVPAALGTATQDLRATVEEKLREIVEAAEARAHEIEDRALAQALEIEQDSEQKARERFQSSTERAEQMTAAIEAFEQEVMQAFQTLRAKGETLAAELLAHPPDAPVVEPPAAEAPVEEALVAEAPVVDAPEVEAPEVEAEPVEAAEPEEGEIVAEEATAEAAPPPAEPTTPEEAREGVRRRILDLFLAGEPRVEAERMLSRLEDGGSYIDLLDEVYEGRSETQQGTPRRRGGRRRRRPGSPE